MGKSTPSLYNLSGSTKVSLAAAPAPVVAAPELIQSYNWSDEIANQAFAATCSLFIGERPG
jgi:hypothetical protein